MARGGIRNNSGRPPKSARTERVWVRLKPTLLDEIERLARAQGRDPGELLSLFVETGMMVWAEDSSKIQPLIID